MNVYVWKTGTRATCDAQTAGEVCERLENEGRLSAGELVDVSRPEDAPLHGAFEWDDAIAAERYRENQAGYIIRSLDVKLVGSEEPVKAFVSLNLTGEKREYSSITTVLSRPDSRKLLLADAMRELRAFKEKYAQFKELAGVFAAIDEAVRNDR